MSAFTTASAAFKDSLKALGTSVVGAGKAAATATAAGARTVGHGVAGADAYFGKQITDVYKGNFGKAIVGISKEHPVYATLAATGAIGATAYAGKKIFGHHSERAMREREQSGERQR